MAEVTIRVRVSVRVPRYVEAVVWVADAVSRILPRRCREPIRERVIAWAVSRIRFDHAPWGGR